jgi:hypothetical protein
MDANDAIKLASVRTFICTLARWTDNRKMDPLIAMSSSSVSASDLRDVVSFPESQSIGASACLR